MHHSFTLRILRVCAPTLAMGGIVTSLGWAAVSSGISDSPIAPGIALPIERPWPIVDFRIAPATVGLETDPMRGLFLLSSSGESETFGLHLGGDPVGLSGAPEKLAGELQGTDAPGEKLGFDAPVQTRQLGNPSFNQTAESLKVPRNDQPGQEGLLHRLQSGGANVSSSGSFNGWTIIGIAVLAIMIAAAITDNAIERKLRQKKRGHRTRHRRHSS